MSYRFARAEASALESERTQVEAQFQEEKAQLDLANREFDLVHREGTLFRSQFYSNPNYTSDSKGKGYVEALAGQQADKQEQVEETQGRIAASEVQLKALDRSLGLRPAGPLAPEQQQEAWQARLRPQREELARVEAELASMRADAAARAFTLHSETSTGSPTANLLRQLETRQAALRSQIESIEEEARHAGALAGWLR
jgi:chromosome segregation ATPase